MQLPGRDRRLRDALVSSVLDAADAIVDDGMAEGVRPTALFGHGLGALIAFEAARRLEARHWPLLALFVSGRRAPALLDPLPRFSQLPMHEFVAELHRRHDVDVPADEDLLRLMLPAMRADAAMLDGYRYDPGHPLHCPIAAFGGTSDPYASRSDLDAWRKETRARFSLHMFAGGHGYLQREQDSVTAALRNQLSVMAGAMARWAAAR